jgi:hypothetical protein
MRRGIAVSPVQGSYFLLMAQAAAMIRGREITHAELMAIIPARTLGGGRVYHPPPARSPTCMGGRGSVRCARWRDRRTGAAVAETVSIELRRDLFEDYSKKN